MPEFKYLDLSTAHIKEKDMKILSEVVEDKDIFTTIAPYYYGCFVGVPMHMGTHVLANCMVLGLSRAVYDAMLLARASNCDVIRFDRDGETTEGLEVFDL